MSRSLSRSLPQSIAALAMLAACGDDILPARADSSTSLGPGAPHDTTGPPSGTSGPVDPTPSARSSSDGDHPDGDHDEHSSGGDTTGSDHGTTSATGGSDFIDPRGYTLVAPMASRYTYLMDADGLEINRWESQTLPANAAYMLPNGHMMRVARDPDATVHLVSGTGGIVQEFDWQGNVVWQYEHTGPTIAAHHDIEPLPNGHVLIIAYEMFSFDEAVAAGRDPATVAPEGLWADFLVEIDPTTDQIVWEWHVWDHLIQGYDPMADHYGVVGDHPERIDINWTRPDDALRPDWTHTNAVAYNAQLDQIVLSPRTFSEIWIIDHSTTTAQAATSEGGHSGMGGDLLYRWGNPATYHAGDTLDRELYFQHDPHWIDDDKPGGGHLLVFDNGDDALRPWSRVLELDTPVLPDGRYSLDGSSFGPLEPAWIYEDPMAFYALFISGADRLADGRTLVCHGPSGQLFEVDATGQVGWTHGVGARLFRAERYDADHPAWNGLHADDLAPGKPLMIEVEPD
ncbi:MAG: aryl-sulfate sulfotransferase [Myxococcota bacterium]